jgi:peptidoglycan/xylan/chitin deacetylase (PgdA/CDA1 family)
VLPLLVSAGAAAGAASWLGYNCYSPTSQLYGRTVALGSDPRQICLTYDDGPNDPHTLRLLEVLAKHDVRATFFLIGQFVKMRPDIARSVVSAGHVIGNHTYTHPSLLWCSAARVRKEFESCDREIADATGVKVNLFRPPFGARRPAVLKVARSFGYTPVMWSVTCFDWEVTTPEGVERKATHQIAKQADRGKIVLLHDGSHLKMGGDRRHTVIATDRLIQRYKGQGYQFVTVPEFTS